MEQNHSEEMKLDKWSERYLIKIILNLIKHDNNINGYTHISFGLLFLYFNSVLMMSHYVSDELSKIKESWDEMDDSLLKTLSILRVVWILFYMDEYIKKRSVEWLGSILYQNGVSAHSASFV